MKRTFKILLWTSFFSIFANQSWADNGLWIEGKEKPELRVNQDLKMLKPDAFKKVAEKVDEAVVNISTIQTINPKRRGFQSPGYPWLGPDSPNQQGPGFNSPFEEFFDRFFGGPNFLPKGAPQQRSLGSGFVLNSDGYIVTNNHVVENADKIRVTFSDESEYSAKIIGRDSKTDVALLKVDSKRKLKNVILGDSSDLSVGDVVVAVGNPFGLSHSVTQGIVSAKERSIGFGSYDDFIQTDASINPGNSGGPLLNLYGEVVGINAAIVAAGQGIGFAIPINLAKNILLNLKKDGKITRGWLGVSIQKITHEHAEAFKLEKKEGALVSEVMKDSPAKKAGLEPGDVIISFDGKPIGDWHSLPLAVANTQPGQTVSLTLIRDGKKQTLPVKIEKLEEGEGESPMGGAASQKDPIGLQVQELTSALAKELGIELEIKGVIVTGVDENSSAATQGIQERDIILEVNRKPVDSLSKYRTATKNLKSGDKVILRIKRGKSTSYVAFSL